MNMVDRFLMKYATFAIVPVIILLIWGSVDDPDKLSMSSGAIRLIWDALGWIFMVWIVVTLFLILRMVFNKGSRDTILKKFARIKERDEREDYISGEAAKFSFLSTLAVMFLLLFFSLFTVKIVKYPQGTRGSDKHGVISIGLNFYPFTKDIPKSNDEGLKSFFDYSGIPLSTSALVILMIIWQLASYQFMVKKLGLDEN